MSDGVCCPQFWLFFFIVLHLYLHKAFLLRQWSRDVWALAQYSSDEGSSEEEEEEEELSEGESSSQGMQWWQAGFLPFWSLLALSLLSALPSSLNELSPLEDCGFPAWFPLWFPPWVVTLLSILWGWVFMLVVSPPTLVFGRGLVVYPLSHTSHGVVALLTGYPS